jgi:hypothetical protein
MPAIGCVAVVKCLNTFFQKYRVSRFYDRYALDRGQASLLQEKCKALLAKSASQFAHPLQHGIQAIAARWRKLSR